MLLNHLHSKRCLMQNRNILEQGELSFPFAPSDVPSLGVFYILPIPQEWNSGDFPVILRKLSNVNKCLCQGSLILFIMITSFPFMLIITWREGARSVSLPQLSSPSLLRRCYQAVGPELSQKVTRCRLRSEHSSRMVAVCSQVAGVLGTLGRH